MSRCCKDDGVEALCKHCRLRIRHDHDRRWVHTESGHMTCDELGFHDGKLYADPLGEPCGTACAAYSSQGVSQWP